MKRLPSLVAKLLPAVCLLLASIAAWAQDDKNKSDIEKRIENAAKVLDEIMATPDKGIPDKIMSDAKCIAVVPSMVKVAVGFGGSHGKGVASCRAENGKWSGVAPITITGGSWGLQLGGQAIDLVMIVMNDDGMQHLLSSKFKIGADASAAAGPVGRHAGANTDWKMKSEVLTYSRSRGLFAGIDLNGAAVTQDKDETRIVYGKFVPFDQILEGKVTSTGMSKPFLTTLSNYTSPTRPEEICNAATERLGTKAVLLRCLQLPMHVELRWLRNVGFGPLVRIYCECRLELAAGGINLVRSNPHSLQCRWVPNSARSKSGHL